jgi:hypothetical protein
MADLEPYIKDRTLPTVVLPGTHNSGTYWLEEFAPPGCIFDPTLKSYEKKCPSGKCSEEGLDVYCGTVCMVSGWWARTQSQSIYDQLSGGVRYFELRFAKHDGKFLIYHTLLGPDSEEIFSDVRRFIDEPGHQKEIIILDISICGFDIIDRQVFTWTLKEKFGHVLIPRDHASYTLDELWTAGEQVVIITEFRGPRFLGRSRRIVGLASHNCRGYSEGGHGSGCSGKARP